MAWILFVVTAHGLAQGKTHEFHLAVLEDQGFRVVASKMVQPNKEIIIKLARNVVKVGNPMKALTEGPFLAFVLEGSSTLNRSVARYDPKTFKEYTISWPTKRGNTDILRLFSPEEIMQ